MNNAILKATSNKEHRYVTELMKPNPVGYFSQPGEILANLGPGQFRKKTWSNFDEPGEKWNLPCDLVEFWKIIRRTND